jgi:hypothetical protein
MVLIPASVFGATAASFAIEQRGIPLLSAGPYGEELWNGVFPWERLRQMASHLKDSDEADDRGSK